MGAWGLISDSHPGVGYLKISSILGLFGDSQQGWGFIWSFHLEMGLIWDHLLCTNTDPSSSPQRMYIFHRMFSGKNFHLFENVSKEAMYPKHEGQNYDQILVLLCVEALKVVLWCSGKECSLQLGGG